MLDVQHSYTLQGLCKHKPRNEMECPQAFNVIADQEDVYMTISMDCAPGKIEHFMNTMKCLAYTRKSLTVL